jgi:hypothetical protein
LGIFWKRFGTPVNDAMSGTQHEFLKAYESWKKQGKPQIMMYFKKAAYLPKTKKELEQWSLVLQFQEQFPTQGLYWTFRNRRDFERLVREHLTNFLKNRI